MELIRKWDSVIERWQQANPDRDMFEDREIEVICGKAIDLGE